MRMIAMALLASAARDVSFARSPGVIGTALMGKAVPPSSRHPHARITAVRGAGAAGRTRIRSMPEPLDTRPSAADAAPAAPRSVVSLLRSLLQTPPCFPAAETGRRPMRQAVNLGHGWRNRRQ